MGRGTERKREEEGDGGGVNADGWTSVSLVIVGGGALGGFKASLAAHSIQLPHLHAPSLAKTVLELSRKDGGIQSSLVMVNVLLLDARELSPELEKRGWLRFPSRLAPREGRSLHRRTKQEGRT